MQIIFVTFSLLKLGRNTEVVHSKQLGRIARMIILLIFFARGRGNGQHRGWADEEELEVR